MMAKHTRLLVSLLFTLSAAGSHAASLQLDNATLSKSAPVRVQYAQVPTSLPPGQMVMIQLIRLENGKEDQVYVRKLDVAKGDSGVQDFGPAYFPGRYEVRLILAGTNGRELARAPLQVVEQAPAPAAPVSRADSPPARKATPSAGCANLPGVSGPVPSGAPAPAEVAKSIRAIFAETYAPINGSAADVCVEFGTLSYRGQQDRKMLSEHKVPVQAGVTSWVLSLPVTITIHKRHGTEVKQRGGKDEVFLFFRDGASWDYRTGRP